MVTDNIMTMSNERFYVARPRYIYIKRCKFKLRDRIKLQFISVDIWNCFM